MLSSPLRSKASTLTLSKVAVALVSPEAFLSERKGQRLIAGNLLDGRRHDRAGFSDKLIDVATERGNGGVLEQSRHRNFYVEDFSLP